MSELVWISEADRLPRIAQGVLLATPRQSGEFWDIHSARLLVRHEGVVPLPVAPGSRWPEYYYWSCSHSGSGNVIVTGNSWWAAIDDIALPPAAEHVTINGYHCIRQIGEPFIPQERRRYG